MGLSLKEIAELSFEQILDRVERGELAEPIVFKIELDNTRTNYLLEIAGNYFAIIDGSDSSATIDIKFNTIGAYAWNFEKGLSLRRPFKRFWITNTAQSAKWVKILVGTLSPQLLEVIDNRVAIAQQQVLEAIRDELKGDTTPETWGTEKTIGITSAIVIASNANRKGCIMQSKKANTGLTYVGFDSTVTATKWIAQLQAGQSLLLDDYRGDIYAISDTAGQLLGWGEW